MPRQRKIAEGAPTTSAGRPATTGIVRSANSASSTRNSLRTSAPGLTTSPGSSCGARPVMTCARKGSVSRTCRHWLQLHAGTRSRTWRPSCRRLLVQRCRSCAGKRKNQARPLSSQAVTSQATIAARMTRRQPSHKAAQNRKPMAMVVITTSMPCFVE